MNTRTGIVFLATCLLGGMLAYAETPPQLQLRDVQRIWDKAPHNAFTDLLFHEGRWYCVFREGSAHVSPDGALRVLTSTDGEHWESLALVT
ncbi:MAG: exo-alpha-sialidase, partial [Planctomycetaceae bacterium]|nr:exo-alpha-sialidase [Planctomycetaceae bacterium]